MSNRELDQRALIYRNLLNGVPEWQIAEMFHVSAQDVMGVFQHVTKKIKDYLFQRCMPPVFCDSLAESKRNRIKLLPLLPKLNLDKDPLHSHIVHERVTPNNVESAFHELRR